MVTENEIRPKDIFDKYLSLSKQDGKSLDKKKFISVSCPACKNKNTVFKFKKFSFKYLECLRCHTLYCNPRPTKTQLKKFYVNSKSAAFWSKEFLPIVESARREKLVKPKVRDIVSHLKGLNFIPKQVCDVGAGHGFVLDELKSFFPRASYYAIEPDAHSCAILRSKEVKVAEGLLGQTDELNSQMDFVTCFEVLEHVFSPLDFAREIHDLLRQEGIALITTLGCEGFDILTLENKSKAISPPHHLNFLSHSGFQHLFKEAGFKEVHIQTPGKLDVDITLNSGVHVPFLEVLKRRGPEVLQAFQKFLAENRLSSHTWIWVKK